MSGQDRAREWVKQHFPYMAGMNFYSADEDNIVPPEVVLERFVAFLGSPHPSVDAAEPTEKQIMDFAEKLQIRHWDMGDDGFGGEWVVSKGRREAIKEFWRLARQQPASVDARGVLEKALVLCRDELKAVLMFYKSKSYCEAREIAVAIEAADSALAESALSQSQTKGKKLMQANGLLACQFGCTEFQVNQECTIHQQPQSTEMPKEVMPTATSTSQTKGRTATEADSSIVSEGSAQSLEQECKDFFAPTSDPAPPAEPAPCKHERTKLIPGKGIVCASCGEHEVNFPLVKNEPAETLSAEGWQPQPEDFDRVNSNPVFRELRQIYCCRGAEFCRPTLQKAWLEIMRLSKTLAASPSGAEVRPRCPKCKGRALKLHWRDGFFYGVCQSLNCVFASQDPTQFFPSPGEAVRAQWVSVKEPPINYGQYLVFCPYEDGDGYKCFRIMEAGYDLDEGWLASGMPSLPTHWQPLPEPPASRALGGQETLFHVETN